MRRVYCAALAGMEIHEYFTTWDWVVVFGYLGITTLVGHRMRGHQATIRDFFLGGRSLPWPAVAGSIVATEISGVTFIGVPGMVFAASGNFTYLQWAIGSIFARFLVGMFFVRFFYEREIYSPYDFMEHRIGRGVKYLATAIFAIGSILGQSVRVLVAALALRVVTPWDFEWCIVVIGLFAVAWTLMGGMRTVIWTDVMQFFLFVGGGLLALIWIVGSLPGGVGEFFSVGVEGGREAGAGAWGKFTTLDLGFAKDAEGVARFKWEAGFTLWVAILAVPFQNLSAFGVDQLNAQRMFCCRNEEQARKAIIYSSFGQFITLLMLLVGAALFVYYRQNAPSEAEAELFAQSSDFVFPTWITTHLPVGIRGLILAGVFAAAISSLDSILAALSQTTLSLFHKTHDVGEDEESGPESEERHARLLGLSRLLVVGWGIFLTGFAILLNKMRGDINMVNLAFGMVSYTVGPLLGMFLAAIVPGRRASLRGLVIGFILSFLAVLYVRPDLYTILINFDVLTPEQAAKWGGVDLNADGTEIRMVFHYSWMWPVSTALTFGCGMLGARKVERA